MSEAKSLPPPRYEPADASPRYILIGGSLLGLGVVLSLIISALLYRAGDQGRRVFNSAQSFRHGPAEKTGIALDWAEQDRLVRAHLEEYGWVNRPAGIVRIPVDRALDLVAAESAAAEKERHP